MRTQGRTCTALIAIGAATMIWIGGDLTIMRLVPALSYGAPTPPKR